MSIPAPAEVVITYRREEAQAATFGTPEGQSEAGSQLPPLKGGKCHVWAASGAQWVKNLPAKTRVPSLGKIPWRRGWQLTPVYLLENPMDRGAWRARVHGGDEELDTTKVTEHTCHV